jgi:hypothetical protein
MAPDVVSYRESIAKTFFITVGSSDNFHAWNLALRLGKRPGAGKELKFSVPVRCG